MPHFYIRRGLYLGVNLELVFLFLSVGSVCLCSLSIASLLQRVGPSFHLPRRLGCLHLLSLCDSLWLLIFLNLPLFNDFKSPLFFLGVLFYWLRVHAGCGPTGWSGCWGCPFFALIFGTWEILRVCLPLAQILLSVLWPFVTNAVPNPVGSAARP